MVVKTVEVLVGMTVHDLETTLVVWLVAWMVALSVYSMVDNLVVARAAMMVYETVVN